MAMLRMSTLCLVCTFSMYALPAVCSDTDNIAPRYDSAAEALKPQSFKAGTPEEDARPGQKYFFEAVRAVKKRQFRFAIDMYKVAASWAYKPAEYNLGVMYLKGEGIPVDLPRAMAWFALAAERNDQHYVDVREAVYAQLSADQFEQANVIWRELNATYGDAVAMRRAKWRWAQTKAAMTGSRVGMPGNLKIGGSLQGQTPRSSGADGKGMADANKSYAGGIFAGGMVDGSVAYRQLQESDNPYDPKFEWHRSPMPTGAATVRRLIPVDEPATGSASPADGTKPPQHNLF